MSKLKNQKDYEETVTLPNIYKLLVDADVDTDLAEKAQAMARDEIYSWVERSEELSKLVFKKRFKKVHSFILNQHSDLDLISAFRDAETLCKHHFINNTYKHKSYELRLNKVQLIGSANKSETMYEILFDIFIDRYRDIVHGED